MRPCELHHFISSCVLATLSVTALIWTGFNQWYILSFGGGVAILLFLYAFWLRPILQAEEQHGYADMFVIKFLLNVSVLLFMFISGFSGTPFGHRYSIAGLIVTFFLVYYILIHMKNLTCATLRRPPPYYFGPAATAVTNAFGCLGCFGWLERCRARREDPEGKANLLPEGTELEVIRRSSN
jgi:hypothetical protein